MRELDEAFVKQLEKEMLNSAELSTAAAAPLIGFVNVEKEKFSKDKLRRGDYPVETIDCNHSLHAMRNLKDAEIFTEREFVIYGKITEEECLKLGINRNKETALSLKMTDYDYMVLLRKQLLTLTETEEPEETVPQVFTRIICSIMDLKTVSIYRGILCYQYFFPSFLLKNVFPTPVNKSLSDFNSNYICEAPANACECL